MNVRSTVLWLLLVVVLALVNYGVMQKEQLRTDGQPLYLELAPVDPRSLIQGDYMRLNYALFTDLVQERQQVVADETIPQSGKLIIDVGADNRGIEAAIYDGTTALDADQLLLNFRDDGWRISIGAETFFFQEGQAEHFEDAKYAELRVSPTGDSILVDLLDENLKSLGQR